MIHKAHNKYPYKKLDEAEFSRHTVFVWVNYMDSLTADFELFTWREYVAREFHNVVYPAPTASEIEFPADCSIVRAYKGLEFKDLNYYAVSACDSQRVETAPTEVEAKAQMWLYLKDKGLIL